MKLYRATSNGVSHWDAKRSAALKWAREQDAAEVEEIEIRDVRTALVSVLNRRPMEATSVCVYSRHQPKKESIEL